MTDTPAAPPPAPRTSPGIFVLIAVLGTLFVGGPMLIRALLVEAFKVPSPAMIPALYRGDHFFASKLRHQPLRGEVIVFRYPLDPGIDYVKRVVAVGGDTVEIANRHLLINGQDLSRREEGRTCPDDEGASEGMLPRPDCQVWSESVGPGRYEIIQGGESSSFGPVAVPPGTVFVMGDNRDFSSDSRMWGPVSLNLVKGPALFVWWSSGPRGVRWDRMFHWVR